jgi:hypothetical protein
LRGWQLTGTGRAYAGAPFTLQVSNVNLDRIRHPSTTNV